MNCDKCGRPSVYHSTLIVNGVSKATNLCRDCAIKEGVFESQTNMFDDMLSVFSDFFPFERVADVSCPVCKTTLREYRSTQRLGCANCYEAFREEIAGIMKRIAPFTNHKQDKILTKAEVPSTLSKQDKIEKLREQLRTAVKEERYEDAGKLKKQIQKLEANNE